MGLCETRYGDGGCGQGIEGLWIGCFGGLVGGLRERLGKALRRRSTEFFPSQEASKLDHTAHVEKQRLCGLDVKATFRYAGSSFDSCPI